MSDEDEHRGSEDRRKEDRRKSQMPFTGEERREGERRSREQLREDYDGAVTRARSALLTYGMDSPEFAAAARATEDINWQIKQYDRAPDPGEAG
jgi:ribosome-binding protein aMBF1 (putative translation factor)